MEHNNFKKYRVILIELLSWILFIVCTGIFLFYPNNTLYFINFLICLLCKMICTIINYKSYKKRENCYSTIMTGFEVVNILSRRRQCCLLSNNHHDLKIVENDLMSLGNNLTELCSIVIRDNVFDNNRLNTIREHNKLLQELLASI